MTDLFYDGVLQYLTTEKIAFAANTDTGAGVTRYLNATFPVGASAAAQANETWYQCRYYVTEAGTLKNFCCNCGAPPGAGDTFVYTLRVNAANTALTCTISGAADYDANDLVNRVAVEPGDFISVSIVTSATAATTRHIAVFELVKRGPT